jgi:hypothetical protein
MTGRRREQGQVARARELAGTRAETSACARSDLHAAFHEAGHFVAHRHLVPSESPVEIAIFGDGTGIYAPGEVRDRAKVRERVVAVYAGAAADLRLDPSREEAIRFHARHDDLEAGRWLDRIGEREREADYRDRARSVVAEHWREIEVIAAMLLDLDALRGDVANMILDLVGGADLESAAKRLQVPPEAAMLIVPIFVLRLTPEHVNQVLARHGYDPRRRASNSAT